MAAGDWPYTYVNTTGSSSTTWAVVFTSGGGGYSGSYVYTGGGGGGGYSAPAPRPQTALEWLDAEIEAVCELARAG